MATFFGSPPFLSSPTLTRPSHHQLSLSSSQSSPPTPQPNQSSEPPPATGPMKVQAPQKVSSAKPLGANNNADSTDWIASNLTRRFGLGAGLAWAGFLAVGVLSEQIKTRLEVSEQEANTRDVEMQEEVVLPNGIRYYELRVGGGATPRPGDLVVIDIKGKIAGKGEETTFVNTFGKQNKALALVMGSRPYTKGMCEGIEYVLRSMRSGGKRKLIVPSNLGFGEKGADLGFGVQIPPFATLEYILEVDKVSIAPA